ncbi:Peptidoglycan-recognition protein LB [Papilio machaon]|uniref:Peptidoglycan-recognition protein LB n=1 Tax=Papilio machaon TaxID=76193 RepID=A0A0N1PIG2_PAPMA|nr:Peptidoglycan-recognition protein LB [Papilio machaon]
MKFYECFILLALVVTGQCFPKPYVKDISYAYDFPFMSRNDWGARPPVNTVSLSLPVPYVIIHHSYIPGPCSTTNQCINAMRSMQNSHQLHQGWDDIGYNFAVGGDGVVYEGRGWNNVGAHALGYNFNSIGIVLIGDFVCKYNNYLLFNEKNFFLADFIYEKSFSLRYSVRLLINCSLTHFVTSTIKVLICAALLE